jgi:hypothetical protein
MILSVIAERLKRRSKDDFKGRHFEASLILQAGSLSLSGFWPRQAGRSAPVITAPKFCTI